MEDEYDKVNHEFFQITVKRFVSQRPDGTGKIKILDSITAKARINDMTQKAKKTRMLFKATKKEMESIIK